MKRTAKTKPVRAVEIAAPPGIVQMNGSYGTETRAYRMAECSILVGREPHGFSTSSIQVPPSTDPARWRWHMSIAHPARYPTWDEMAEAREQLLPGALAFAIIFPAVWDYYVNAHPNCFHLWEVHDRDG